MTKRSTREDYANRIGRALAHIHANLDAPLDTERLAEIACFSPFHWHRIYQGMTGETVGQTVRRVRLHRAATALVESDRPIAAIAREAGYRCRPRPTASGGGFLQASSYPNCKEPTCPTSP